MSSGLEARSLTKFYNHIAAVRNVSFQIEPGEILGCLGPNGAGKSTTVRMLTGLTEPSEGRIFYRGSSVYEDLAGFQSRLGYVPEEAHLYPHLSGREYLEMAGQLRGMERRVLEPKMDELLRLFSLWNERQTPLASYSKGMRQKILIAAALLHNPDILVLDEPFSGLDVAAALMLRRLLRSLADEGKIVLYSSHVLEVVEKVCSKVLILRKGEVVAYDSVQRLQVLMSQPSLEGVFAQLAEVDDSETTAQAVLGAMALGQEAETPPKPVEVSRRISRALAEKFPYEFQNACGEEMRQAAEDSIEPVWKHQGWLGLLRLLMDLAIRLPLEHLAEMRQDVRYGLRMLARSPGFTFVALLSLTLGIAVATSAFSEMNGFFLRDVPGVARPGELVMLKGPVSFPSYERYRERSDLFASAMAYVAPVPLGVGFDGRSERMWGHLVTPSYFSTLGVSPFLGRLAETPSEVVVSYRFWKDYLNSDPSPSGKTIRINGRSCVISGVAPRDFQGASPMLYGADLWLAVSPEQHIAPELARDALDRSDLEIFYMTARLRKAVPAARAESVLDAMARQIEADRGDPDRNRKGRRVAVHPGGKLLPIKKEDLPVVTGFFTLLGGMILLIASSNVANMMLARAVERRKEIAVRLALGAGRARLIRQLLTESMLLAMASGVLGFCLAAWIMNLASRERIPTPMPITFTLQPDATVVLFTIGLTLFTGLAFGIAPALQATRANLSPALKEGGYFQLRRFRRLSLRNMLVLSQVAGSLALLLITGFLVIGHQRIVGGGVGFEARNLYVLSIDPIRAGYTGTQSSAFFHKLLERIQGQPSTVAATLAESSPMAMIGRPGATFSVTGPDGAKALHWGRRMVVGKDHFATVGIPIVRGRGFQPEDETDDSAAAIVSEKIAEECWKGQDPLGQRIMIGDDEVARFDFVAGSGGRAHVQGRSRTIEVVGVAKNMRDGLDLVPARAPGMIYVPLRPADYARPVLHGLTLLARSTPGVDALRMARSEIAALDDNLKPFDARSMTEQIDELMFPVRVALWTYGFIGAFGLILASVGLAGMTAYSVTQRRHEIGVRIALGARAADVLGLVMKEGAVLVGVGTAIGLALARGGIRLLSASLSSVASAAGTSTSDPLLLIGAPAVLAALAMAACYLPARQSTRVDPVVTLRAD